MKYNMKYTKVLGLAVAATLAFGACSDEWDAHYDVQPIGDGGGNLWEVISEDESLSNFKMVLDSCGFSNTLKSPQVFTVFAPTNDALTTDDALQLIAEYRQQKSARVKDDDNSTLKEFVKNHISLYNYSANQDVQVLEMLNGKHMELSQSSFGGKTFVSSNERCDNGILFKIGEKADFFHNVFEYLAADDELTGVASFLYGYNKYEFMPGMSVQGGIENGKTWYVDSVEILRNEMLERVLGTINNEDSVYKMVVPTDSEWNRLVEEYTAYFNYNDSVDKRDSLTYLNARLAILRGTVFSKSLNTAGWNEEALDSAVSTNAIPYSLRKYYYGSSDVHYYYYYKPYASGGIFDGAEKITCSNGQLLKANQWNIDKTETFCQVIKSEAETSMLDFDKSQTLQPTYLFLESNHPFYNKMSGNQSLILVQKTSTATASVEIGLGGVLSNVPYDIQMVLAPSYLYYLAQGDTIVNPLPNVIAAKLNYPDQTGKTQIEEFEAPDGMPFFYTENYMQMDTITLFKNFKFPTATYGSGTTEEVYLNIENQYFEAFDAGIASKHMLIDCIILKPVSETEVQ